MRKFDKICEHLMKEGLAESAYGKSIRITNSIDAHKMSDVERSYANAFKKRWTSRKAREREAERKYQDFVVTY